MCSCWVLPIYSNNPMQATDYSSGLWTSYLSLRRKKSANNPEHAQDYSSCYSRCICRKVNCAKSFEREFKRFMHFVSVAKT